MFKQGINMKNQNYLSTSVAAIAGVILLIGANVSSASVVDLGAASGFSVISYNSSNVSDSAFQGGNIAVVNGNWTQSGGQQTNAQMPTTVYLSTGHTNGGPAVETTVFNNTLVNNAWSAATTASANLAALSPTQTLGAITTNTTITESLVGNYVLSISDITLNHPESLTLSAPAGSTFVLNISGSIKINGSAGSGLLLAGGLTTNDVVYNLTGASSSLTTAGGGNGSLIQGIVLATGANASVNLHPGEVDGAVITRTFTSSSGALVLTSIPEANSGLVLIPFVLGMLVLALKKMVPAKDDEPVLAEGRA